MEKKQKFDVLAVPCSRAFVVATEKTEEFRNLKPNPDVRNQIEEKIEKFRVNNLVEKGPVLKKVRKHNEK